MGEHPVTAKPGHLPRDTMLPADNAKLKLPRDPERFAKHRPEDVDLSHPDIIQNHGVPTSTITTNANAVEKNSNNSNRFS